MQYGQSSRYDSDLLTFTLMELKVIKAFAIIIGQCQLAHPCSLNRPYTVGSPTSNPHFNIPRNSEWSSEMDAG